MTEDRADLDPPGGEEVAALPHGLSTHLGRDAVWATVPPWLESSVMRELGISSGDNVVPLRRGLLREGEGRRRTGRRLVLAAAAAAVVGLASTAGLAALDSSDSSDASMRLAGTTLLPDGRMRAELRSTPSGIEITVDAEGLPPARANTYYQGWVVGARGAVTIGTFHMRGGSKDVVLWSGVDLAEYPTMTVTVQQEGGGPASSGEVLLRGQIPDSIR
jgi:hypothetical protein